jgi:hypothetical protein
LNSSVRAASSGSAWIANGATACEKYLTPAVTAAILRTPPGHAQRADANSCNAYPIYIGLKVTSVAVFRQQLPLIAFAHPISGIGDAAFWNDAGAVSAVKGDRGCDISASFPGPRRSPAQRSRKSSARFAISCSRCRRPYPRGLQTV